MSLFHAVDRLMNDLVPVKRLPCSRVLVFEQMVIVPVACPMMSPLPLVAVRV